jgi:ATP-dependent Clp protease ATP-binding subunit ClpA
MPEPSKPHHPSLIFSKHLTKTIFLAREEAASLQSLSIDIEHLILGLLLNDGSAARRVMEESGADIEKAVADLRITLSKKMGHEIYADMKMIPFTRDAKDILDKAAETCNAMGLKQLGTTPLLMALISKHFDKLGPLF